MSLRANLRHRAPDGTALAYDVHLPVSDGPVPTVLLRTPYGRSRHLDEGRGWARRGFAFVAADVRGRYDSDGVWSPYLGERADGAALVDEIVAAPWSDGRIVAIGGSYSGYTAWATAVERPANIAAVVSLGPSMSLARTKFSPAGMLRLGEHAAWWIERGDARTSRDGLAARLFAERPELLDHLPVAGIADKSGIDLPGWRAIVEDGPHHITGEEITEGELAALRVPSLHVGGWHDLLLRETLAHWERVGDESTPKRLMIGPWLHDLVFSSATGVGALEHGESARIDWASDVVDWIRDALGGRLPRRRADVFVIGSGWRQATAWPPPASPERVALGSGSFVADPGDPYPSRAEAVDRGALLARTDALRLPVRVSGRRFEGPVSLHLRGIADIDVADWIARLLLIRDAAGDVEPSIEIAVEVAVGETTVTDARSRHEAVIDLGALALLVPEGGRLVLEITGHDHPRLARNLGVVERSSAGPTEVPAAFEQTVLDAWLTLPACPEDAL